jgi:hypothetical protein
LTSTLALESENQTILLFSGLKFWGYYLLISLNLFFWKLKNIEKYGTFFTGMDY